MALCDKCLMFDKAYNELREAHDDIIKIHGDKRPHRFCIMYDDFIPQNITYENADCPYFMPKENDK